MTRRINQVENATTDFIIDLDTFPGCTVKDFQLIMGVLIGYIEKRFFSRPDRWTLRGILAGDFTSLLCLLVDLAIELDCPHPIPPNVTLIVTITTQENGVTATKNAKFQITGTAGSIIYGKASSRDGLIFYFIFRIIFK